MIPDDPMDESQTTMTPSAPFFSRTTATLSSAATVNTAESPSGVEVRDQGRGVGMERSIANGDGDIYEDPARDSSGRPQWCRFVTGTL